MFRISSLSAAALLATCAALPAQAAPDRMATARFGQTVRVDGPRVTPVRLLEDSRCPMESRCAWAGEVRILARVRTGRGSTIREMTLGKPVSVADGQLELASVMPPKSVQRAVQIRDYRFGFRFSGGL